jgi:hypothetical protein
MSMASNARHAAWHTERRFAVKLYPADGPTTELAGDLTDFLDAVDFAFDWLNTEDPARNGSSTLAIVELHDGVSEEVWTYPPAPGTTDQLVGRLGFNPVTWTGTPDYSAAEQKSRLRARVALTATRLPLRPVHVAPVAEPPEPAPAVAPAVPVAWAPPEPEPQQPPLRSNRTADARVELRKWLQTNARIAWDDLISRVLLILAGATLWFTIGLADPVFLVPLAIFVSGLWWRHGHRPEQVDDPDHEEWL